MHLARSIRSTIAATALTGLVATATLAGSAASATTEGGIAWTVQTVDNDNGASRGNFTYAAEPGEAISDAMRVVNTGTEPLPLDVDAADAFTTPSGQIDVLVDGTPSEDAGTWIAVDSARIELAPGEGTDVTFTVTVPADARPGDHAAGLVTSLRGTDETATLAVDRRLGTRINVRVAGELSPAADVEAFATAYEPSWNPFAPGTLVVTYTVDNAGNTRVTGSERIFAAGPLGLLDTATAPAQLPEVLPGSVIDVRRTLPAASLGWLTGSLTIAPEGIGLGGDTLAPVIVEYSIVAIPWSLYALVLVMAGSAVGTLLLLRRRRRRVVTARPGPGGSGA
jgi:archaellum component FlaG (FlaF/FlaG flagellin family)